MRGGSGRPAPRRAGVAAQVKATRQGTRVMLYAGGARRWGAAAFLAIALIAWAAGELLATGVLVRPLSLPLSPFAGMQMPPDIRSLADHVVLLGGLALWTGGGFAALFTMARTAWGVDVLTVSADRWSVWWGIGRWGHGRRFLTKKLGRIELRGRAGVLVAQIEGRTVKLTRFGTDAERLWLRDLLQDAASGLRDAESGAVASR